MATLLQDDFNRANDAASLGSPVVGGPYTVRSGTWGINNNEAYLGTPVTSAQVTFSAAIDVHLSMKIAAAITSTIIPSLMLRWVDVNNYWTLLRVNNSTYAPWRVNAGTGTQLGPEFPVALGDVISVRAFGDQIGWYGNGKPYGVLTDHWFSTATNVCGLRSGGSGVARFDDLLAEDQTTLPGSWGGAAAMELSDTTDTVDSTFTLTPALYKGRNTAAADESEIP